MRSASGAIEQKINALDQAAPLQGWELPEAFTTLRRLMEARMGKQGRRVYVQVLRLLESFDPADLHHVSILEMNGDSYRLAQSRIRKTAAAQP